MKASNLWALLGIVPAVGGYTLAGWLGVGVAGLLIAFIAFRMGIEIDGPVGPQNTPELYASLRRQDSVPRGERLARNAERRSALHLLLIAKVVGGLLILVGFAGFFVVQFPR